MTRVELDDDILLVPVDVLHKAHFVPRRRDRARALGGVDADVLPSESVARHDEQAASRLLRRGDEEPPVIPALLIGDVAIALLADAIAVRDVEGHDDIRRHPMTHDCFGVSVTSWTSLAGTGPWRRQTHRGRVLRVSSRFT